MTQKRARVTYEQLVDHCIALRVAFEQDEAKFFLGLYDTESEYLSVIVDAVGSFNSFLRSLELCRVERYRAFADGMKHTTSEEALAMGAPAVMQLANLRDESKADEYKAAAVLWSQDNHGKKATSQTAAHILRQVDPRPERPAPLRRNDELNKLREECSALRKEVARLRRENAKLREQLGGEAA